MSPGYSLQFGGKPAQVYKGAGLFISNIFSSREKTINISGKLDCIELTVATRSGNKKVTLINNLDTYQVRD